MPGVSIDCVVFGYHDGRLHVLLLRYRENIAWALPGGFLPIDKEMDEVAGQILQERTSVANVFLQQFHTFSGLDRGWHYDKKNRAGFQNVQALWDPADRPTLEKWFNQRFISTAYFALINSSKVKPIPDQISDACTWVPIDDLPELVLDHRQIIDRALDHLRKKINYLPIGKELMDEKFTMLELQTLYEIILGKQLDRGNFQRKIIKLNMLVRHEKLMTGAQNKAPFLYSIDNKAYERLIQQGIGFS